MAEGEVGTFEHALDVDPTSLHACGKGQEHMFGPELWRANSVSKDNASSERVKLLVAQSRDAVRASVASVATAIRTHALRTEIALPCPEARPVPEDLDLEEELATRVTNVHRTAEHVLHTIEEMDKRSENRLRVIVLACAKPIFFVPAAIAHDWGVTAFFGAIFVGEVWAIWAWRPQRAKRMAAAYSPFMRAVEDFDACARRLLEEAKRQPAGDDPGPGTGHRIFAARSGDIGSTSISVRAVQPADTSAPIVLLDGADVPVAHGDEPVARVDGSATSHREPDLICTVASEHLREVHRVVATSRQYLQDEGRLEALQPPLRVSPTPRPADAQPMQELQSTVVAARSAYERLRKEVDGFDGESELLARCFVIFVLPCLVIALALIERSWLWALGFGLAGTYLAYLAWTRWPRRRTRVREWYAPIAQAAADAETWHACVVEGAATGSIELFAESPSDSEAPLRRESSCQRAPMADGQSPAALLALERREAVHRTVKLAEEMLKDRSLHGHLDPHIQLGATSATGPGEPMEELQRLLVAAEEARERLRETVESFAKNENQLQQALVALLTAGVFFVACLAAHQWLVSLLPGALLALMLPVTWGVLPRKRKRVRELYAPLAQAHVDADTWYDRVLGFD